jgi:hypothetical protein
MSECEILETEIVSSTVATTELEAVELADQGPPGPPGRDGFTSAIDIISGGAPDTDYTDGYIFSGGTP